MLRMHDSQICRWRYSLMKSALQGFLSYALISHTNAHAVRGRPTINDFERFRDGPVHELFSVKASQMCKVHTSSQEIKNGPYVSLNFENTGKTVTADLTKIKNVREHNFEGGANNIRGVDNLLEEINVIKNKQECQTMQYDIKFICCSCKITEIERKRMMRKHIKKTCVTAWNLLPICVFSIVFCIASYSTCFSPVAWQSSGPNNTR